jgi:hypothetical protein
MRASERGSECHVCDGSNNFVVVELFKLQWRWAVGRYLVGLYREFRRGRMKFKGLCKAGYIHAPDAAESTRYDS